MDTELATRIDRSLGPAPEGPDPLADLLREGHRAVRRRRLAVTVASAVAVLAVGGGTALATGGGDGGRAEAPVAEPPSSTSAPTPTPTATFSPSVEPPVGSDVFPGTPADGLVTFGGGTGERLFPSEGVEILEQRPGVDVGPSFAGPGDRTAAARVRTPDGEVLYLLAREVEGQAQVITVPRATGGPDLDAFLRFARERYAEGGGGLL